jgi:flagellar motility protein MotE (MotC chaperone)
LSRRARSARLVEQRHIRERLISVAGLVGRPVRLQDGRAVGRLVDVVSIWTGDAHPAVAGVVVRIGRRRAFVPIGDVDRIDMSGVALSSPRLDVRDFTARPGEVALMHDVVDHQLVDIDGVQVVRAADLYLAQVGRAWQLVGVETGVLALLRRLGPAHWRARATPERVVDWADVQPVGRPGTLRLERAHAHLRRLRPGDVADLLESLGQPQRQHLLDALDVDVAADALEEMDDDQRDRLLRHLPPARAAALIAEMEPDEAADALRGLAPGTRAALLASLPPDDRAAVGTVLGHPGDTAGGIMTTVIAEARESDSVGAVIARLRAFEAHRADVDGVLVLSPDGRLLDDVSLFELAVARPDRPIGELVGPPWPIVVTADASMDEVADAVLSNRRGSIVVVDDTGGPLGRILIDDVLDALVVRPARLHREVGDQ